MIERHVILAFHWTERVQPAVTTLPSGLLETVHLMPPRNFARVMFITQTEIYKGFVATVC